MIVMARSPLFAESLTRADLRVGTTLRWADIQKGFVSPVRTVLAPPVVEHRIDGVQLSGGWRALAPIGIVPFKGLPGGPAWSQTCFAVRVTQDEAGELRMIALLVQYPQLAWRSV